MLAKKPTYEVGIHFGLDKYYKSEGGLKNKVYKVYREICAVDDDEELKRVYGLGRENVNLVHDIVSNRSANQVQETLREKLAKDEKTDIRDMLLKGRKSALALAQKKMERIGDSMKQLDKTRLTELTTAFGILFDKAQLIDGNATEHVAVLANMEDKKIDPETAIDAVVKIRERNIETKTRDK